MEQLLGAGQCRDKPARGAALPCHLAAGLQLRYRVDS